MRLVTFWKDARWRPAALEGEVVVELSAVDGADGGDDVRAVIVSLMQGRTVSRGAVYPRGDVRFGAPVPNPGKTICIGLNYREHAKEGGNPIPDYPAVFLRAGTSLIADGEPLIVPACSPQLDYEAELAIIIGRTARNVPRAEALDYVFGYSCFNDGSVRDFQRKSGQWTIGKNFDATGAFGPAVVTADELPPGAEGLSVRCQLNGTTMQDGNTSDMIFPVPRLIEILSEAMTLEPGDVIITGTPSGVGYARKPPVFLREGDVCTIEIDGIGRLSNPVTAA
ncbi:MAG TPA: 5-oxopent-3-ene-1,2,5-tricarboxylate decarboxylase [Acetobacteraceae bacterium]|jgi:acylpyruvate hydrolase|nr:5-oxopent-3-ene-1,2,5-tricarboxylate decarboxylase [Acetobacteraceae bacterium]